MSWWHSSLVVAVVIMKMGAEDGWTYSCVHCDRTRRSVIDDFPMAKWSVMHGPVMLYSIDSASFHRGPGYGYEY